MDEQTAALDERVTRWWMVFFRRPEEDRLAASLAASEVALAARVKLLPPVSLSGVTPETIADALRRARKAYVRGALDEGWQCLEEAHRLAVHAATPGELRGRAIALRTEAAHKLRGWRREAVMTLSTTVAEARDPSAALLYEALLLRDAHHQNRYHQTRLLSRQFKTVGAYLVLALSTALVLGWAGMPMPVGSTAGPAGRAIVVWMALFGVLGAAFSLALPLTRGTNGERIPDQIQSQAVTGFRPLLGAAAGTVAYAFVQSEILNLPTADGALLLSIAFVAGFSERLVLRAVSAVAADESAPAGRRRVDRDDDDAAVGPSSLAPDAVGQLDRRTAPRGARAVTTEGGAPAGSGAEPRD